MVGFKVKFYWYQIGSGDFLHAFFSTVAYNLENMKWGSRFPVIMKELYQGHLPKEHVDAAIGELAVISAELRDLSPVHVIWDIEDLSKQPPWGNDISEDITDLSNYFVTSDGEDFLTILLHALEKAKDVNEDVHKDHWDVSDPKGKKVKEVDFDGRKIWPGGPKNKNK